VRGISLRLTAVTVSTDKKTERQDHVNECFDEIGCRQALLRKPTTKLQDNRRL